jgi:hypothetical protein
MHKSVGNQGFSLAQRHTVYKNHQNLMWFLFSAVILTFSVGGKVSDFESASL